MNTVKENPAEISFKERHIHIYSPHHLAVISSKHYLLKKRCSLGLNRIPEHTRDDNKKVSIKMPPSGLTGNTVTAGTLTQTLTVHEVAPTVSVHFAKVPSPWQRK